MGERVAIIKVGSTYPSIAQEHGDFEHWITRGAGLTAGDVDVVDVVAGQALPDPTAPHGVIVTGSPAMVTERAEWSERTAGWLAQVVAAGTPVLGICYGHQLLAHGLGGVVDRNPRGRQVGTIDVTLGPLAESDPLLSDLPKVSHLPVSHLQSVLEPPAGARILAAAPRDPHHAIAFGPRAWGVQFHPEFNALIVRGYIRERYAAIQAEGLDPDALSASASDTAHGGTVLRRFLSLTGA